MKIAKDLPKPDQEQKPSKKPYTTPRLITYGSVEELTRGNVGTVRTDLSSETVKVPR